MKREKKVPILWGIFSPGTMGWSKDICCCMGTIPNVLLFTWTASCWVGGAPLLFTCHFRSKMMTPRTKQQANKHYERDATHVSMCAGKGNVCIQRISRVY